MNLSNYIQAFAESATRAWNSRIEAAVEESLQGGEHGVLVDHDNFTVSVSALVPYGHVYFVNTGWRNSEQRSQS